MEIRGVLVADWRVGVRVMVPPAGAVAALVVRVPAMLVPSVGTAVRVVVDNGVADLLTVDVAAVAVTAPLTVVRPPGVFVLTTASGLSVNISVAVAVTRPPVDDEEGVLDAEFWPAAGDGVAEGTRRVAVALVVGSVVPAPTAGVADASSVATGASVSGNRSSVTDGSTATLSSAVAVLSILWLGVTSGSTVDVAASLVGVSV